LLRSLRPREGQLQREAGRIPTRTGAARTGKAWFTSFRKRAQMPSRDDMIGLDGTWVAQIRTVLIRRVVEREASLCANVQSIGIRELVHSPRR